MPRTFAPAPRETIGQTPGEAKRLTPNERREQALATCERRYPTPGEAAATFGLYVDTPIIQCPPRAAEGALHWTPRAHADETSERPVVRWDGRASDFTSLLRCRAADFRTIERQAWHWNDHRDTHTLRGRDVRRIMRLHKRRGRSRSFRRRAYRDLMRLVNGQRITDAMADAMREGATA